MKSKNLKIILIIFSFVFLVFLNVNSVYADSCTDCAAKNGGRCGLCGYSCAVDKDGTCVLNKNYDSGSTSNNSNKSKTTKVSCGNVTGIPKKIPDLTSDIVKILQVVVPIILIIMGTIDLVKGITSQKEDEMKKGQQMLVKRLITGALIFFIVAITKLLISVVSDSTNSDNIVDCVDCFISGDCK